MNKIFQLGIVAVLAILFSSSTTAKADVFMTGIMDGTLSADGGGSPKAVEIYATSDIADLSLYALSRAGNGSSTFDTITADFIFPAISLSAGDYYYGVGNPFVDMTGTFETIFPGTMNSRNFGVNSNGDDVTGLFFDASGAFTGGETLVDVFGVLGTDGTGEPWEHVDSWAYRNNNTVANGSFTIGNWTIAPINSLDGLDAAGIGAAVPFGTFNPVPEPGSLAVLGLFTLVGLTNRRRSKN